jgi:hypothetical protein
MSATDQQLNTLVVSILAKAAKKESVGKLKEKDVIDVANQLNLNPEDTQIIKNIYSRVSRHWTKPEDEDPVKLTANAIRALGILLNNPRPPTTEKGWFQLQKDSDMSNSEVKSLKKEKHWGSTFAWFMALLMKTLYSGGKMAYRSIGWPLIIALVALWFTGYIQYVSAKAKGWFYKKMRSLAETFRPPDFVSVLGFSKKRILDFSRKRPKQRAPAPQRRRHKTQPTAYIPKLVPVTPQPVFEEGEYEPNEAFDLLSR